MTGIERAPGRLGDRPSLFGDERVQIVPAISKNELNFDRCYYFPAFRGAYLLSAVNSCLTADREEASAGR